MIERLEELFARLQKLQRQLATERAAKLECLGQQRNSHFFPGTQPRGLS